MAAGSVREARCTLRWVRIKDYESPPELSGAEHLEQVPIVVRRDAPLLVVVGEHERVSPSCPLATLAVFHRWIGSHAMRLAPLFAVVVLAFAAGCGGSDEESAETPTTTAAISECASVEAPEPRDPGSKEAPTAPLEDGRTYALTFETSCGSFTVTLDTELAPNTAASLVALAEAGYFDDTIFHRVVPDFVIQGGDPTQSGSGGPGYSTVDVPPSDAVYTKGTVAMAKSGVEGPGTAGSQFFVVTADGTGLTPEYAIVGEVTAGIDTIDRIGALGVTDGPPSQPVVIDSVTVTTS
jgi:cyclophilin family peptidyl-prolyl cis-trans isomerase